MSNINQRITMVGALAAALIADGNAPRADVTELKLTDMPEWRKKQMRAAASKRMGHLRYDSARHGPARRARANKPKGKSGVRAAKKARRMEREAALAKARQTYNDQFQSAGYAGPMEIPLEEVPAHPLTGHHADCLCSLCTRDQRPGEVDANSAEV